MKRRRPALGDRSTRQAAGAAFLGLALAASGAPAQHIPDTVTDNVLRVCADPANMPFSDRQGEGFENRIAAIVADELKVPLRYYFVPQGPGYVRNTLGTNLCDVIVGYASGADIVQATNPYYRSVFVLIVKKGGPLDGVEQLSDARLKGKRLGVTAATPPVDYLNKYGLMADARTYALLVDRRYSSPSEEMIAHLVAGEIDGALLWGPIAGYFAQKASEPLTVVPLVKETSGPALAFRITMGIRHNELDWKHALNRVIDKRQVDIDKVLLTYGVPLLDESDGLITSSTDAGPSTPAAR